VIDDGHDGSSQREHAADELGTRPPDAADLMWLT
jgi:hypothetical protein